MRNPYGPAIAKCVEKRLEEMGYPEKRTKALDPKSTVEALRSFPGTELPPLTGQFVDEYESGKMKPLRGANRKGSLQQLRDDLIVTSYPKYLKFFQKHQKFPLESGAPCEKAALLANQMASRITGLPCLSVGHTLNLVARYESRPR